MDERAPDLRIFSFGGGVQSVAALVLASQGVIRYDAFVFSNVGEDSENPDTIDYINQYVIPFSVEHELRYVEVRKTRKEKGRVVAEPTTLLKEMERAKKSVLIPIRMANGAPGNRNCTTDFKIRVIDKYIRELPSVTRDTYVRIGLGISTDEWERARDTEWHSVESATAKHPRKIGFWKGREYPLLELKLNRQACAKIIQDAGLPIPPKSSCFFCPLHTKQAWFEMRRKRPDLFNKAVEVERMCNVKRLDVARDGAFLSSALKPLDVAIPEFVDFSFGEEVQESCDDAYCMT